jgi:NAD(P)H-dependent FMN reductase
MIRLGIIIGGIRPGPNGAAVAQWVHEVAAQRTDAEFELVDLSRLPGCVVRSAR